MFSSVDWTFAEEFLPRWIIDDTSFPKCGSKSVGVQHQYCGQLGKQANCQVAVTLSIANHHASLPIAYRLYLPEEWKDAARRKKARVPKAITFKTKPEIALEQIRKAYAAGVPRGAVLIDASYGSNSALRTGISALGLKYAAAIVPTVKVRKVSDRGALQARLSTKQLASACRNMLGARSPGVRERTISCASALCPRAGAHRADQRRRETRRRNTVDRMARWTA